MATLHEKTKKLAEAAKEVCGASGATLLDYALRGDRPKPR